MDGWMGWMDGNASLAEYTHGLVFFFLSSSLSFPCMLAGWYGVLAFVRDCWMDGSVGGLIEFSSYKEMKGKEK